MILAKAQPEADPSSGGAKDAKFGEIGKKFPFGPFGGVYPFDSLRAGSDKGMAQDRLGAKYFVEVVLLNILSVRI